MSCRRVILFVALAFALLLAPFASRVQAQSGANVRPLITQNIDESKLVPLGGNTRPEVTPASDRGIVANDFLMDHMLLQLRRAPEQERSLQQFLDDLQNPQSPNFHHWLTASQFGERFGVAQQDIDSITRWLESYGFQINVVYPSRMLIDFSGTGSKIPHANGLSACIAGSSIR